MICSNCESTEFACGGCGVNLQPADAYTAAEVKVLTETATRLGRELGRREAFGEMAEAFEGLIPFLALDSPTADAVTQTAQNFRNLASPASGAASDAASVPSEGPGTSEPSKAASNRLPGSCLYEDRHWTEVHECCREVSPCPVARQGVAKEPS